MNARSWVIGSSPECDIRVESATVSGRHCRLTERGESFLLEDLQSSNGTFVADERIASRRIVRRGDPVTLGRNTPLPWPAAVTSITIGRLSDNDLVISLETVSGHHARMEREGNQVYLVDLGSTNGTAINDPLNKITRAPVKATDFVFLGTHRVSAADLLSALPAEARRQATLPERQRPSELEQAIASSRVPAKIEPSTAGLTPWPRAMYLRSSWLWGIALSALFLLVVFGGRWLFRRPDTAVDRPNSAAPVDPPADTAVTHAPPAALPQRVNENPAPMKTSSTRNQSPPDEKLVRRAEEAVVLVGLRLQSKIVITEVETTAWACAPNMVICPTPILARLDKLKEKGGPENLIVCTPAGPIAILSHRSGAGPAAGFSVATLEVPLDITCTMRAQPADFIPLPGQKLAILYGHSQDDDPQTIVRSYTSLTIERIERLDQAPVMIICRSDGNVAAASGAPIFDASGSVVGCVQAADAATGTVRMVPLSRLPSLLPSGI